MYPSELESIPLTSGDYFRQYQTPELYHFIIRHHAKYMDKMMIGNQRASIDCFHEANNSGIWSYNARPELLTDIGRPKNRNRF